MAKENSILRQVRGSLRRQVAPHRHSALLAALVTAFAVRPLIGESGAGTILFGIAEVILLLVALYNINVDEMVGERDHLPPEQKETPPRLDARHGGCGWSRLHERVSSQQNAGHCKFDLLAAVPRICHDK